MQKIKGNWQKHLPETGKEQTESKTWRKNSMETSKEREIENEQEGQTDSNPWKISEVGIECRARQGSRVSRRFRRKSEVERANIKYR
jgi:hypothetical protein